MPVVFNFEIEILDYNLVVVRWPVAFGRLLSEPYQALALTLEGLAGVNRVEVLRYSAYVYVAEHVEHLLGVAESIEVALLEDGVLLGCLREHGVTNYGVTRLPVGLIPRQ
jgi:hypothetical protein